METPTRGGDLAGVRKMTERERSIKSGQLEFKIRGVTVEIHRDLNAMQTEFVGTVPLRVLANLAGVKQCDKT
jgi:hypothetical protein